MDSQTKYEHIYIVGTGAVGKALAASLKVEDRKVTLIRGSVNDGSARQEFEEDLRIARKYHIRTFLFPTLLQA